MIGSRKLTLLLKIFSAFIIIAALIFTSLDKGAFKMSADAAGTITNPDGPVSYENMGKWNHYNGLIFNQLTAYQADAEGALAVGKTISVGLKSGYDIGASYNYYPTVHIGQYKNDKKYPSLLFGGQSIKKGNPSSGSHFNVFGGPIVMSKDVLSDSPFSLSTGASYAYAENDVLTKWFDDTYKKVKNISNELTRASSGNITIDELTSGSYISGGASRFVNQTILYNGAIDKSILVINISSKASLEFGWWPQMVLDMNWLLNDNYSLVVLNFPDVYNISFSGDPISFRNSTGVNLVWPESYLSAQAKKEKQAAGSKLVYNFPNAQQISSTSCNIIGSVLAPEATFQGNGGSLNGQLICQNYETQGAHELHALNLTDRIYDVAEEDEEDLTGAISISKYLYLYDTASDILLDKARFILYREEGSEKIYYKNGGVEASDEIDARSDPIIIHNGGPVTITELPLGKYVLEEVEPPPGYLLNTTHSENEYTYYRYEFELTEDDADKTMEINRYNYPLTIDVYFRKISSYDQSILSGGKFTLFREADKHTAESTIIGEELQSFDENGMLTFGELPTGTYRLQEVESPDGYSITGEGDFRFEIYREGDQLKIRDPDDENKELNLGTKDDPLIIENDPGESRSYVYIYKYNATGMDLEDSPFLADSLTNSENTVTDDIQTGLQGAKFDLYKFVQENANDQGYWQLVEDNGLPEDDPNYHEVKIVTNAAGFYYISSLTTGTYRLIETAAPDGFILSNGYQDQGFINNNGELWNEGYYAWQFSLDPDQNGTIEYIPNKAKVAEVIVEKKGRYGDGIEELLDGVKFRLYKVLDGVGGSQLEAIYNSVSTIDGKLTLSDLDEGAYRLREIDTLIGYVLMNPEYLEFTIDFVDGQDEPDFTLIYDGQFVDEDGEEAADEDEKPVSWKVNKDKENSFTISVINYAKTVSLRLYKEDQDIYQTGRVFSSDFSLNINYLEGAEFQLQREDEGGIWHDYGERFESELLYIEENGEKVPDLDDFGNHKAAAECDGLIAGTYRVLEVDTPEGYEITSSVEVEVMDPEDPEKTTTAYRVSQFVLTPKMIETNAVPEMTFTVFNALDAPKSEVNIRKIDKDTQQGLDNVEFKLWEIKEGAEEWDGSEELNDLMDYYDDLVLAKYATDFTGPLVTQNGGRLNLGNLTPGVYVLFENTPPSDDYIYFLEPGNTSASSFNRSFLLHIVMFKVAAIDENNKNAGTKIEWVNRESLEQGKAIFSENELELTLTNKKADISADVEFRKIGSGEEVNPLEYAEFSIYRLDEDDNWIEYGPGRISGSNGEVVFSKLGVTKSNTMTDTRNGFVFYEYQDTYLIKETKAPNGYQLSEEEICFRLYLNPMTQLLDLYILDPLTMEELDYSPGEENKEGSRQLFYLRDYENQKLTDFQFTKVDAEDDTISLSGARFALYRCKNAEQGCSNNHTEFNSLEESCWTDPIYGKSGDDGIVNFEELSPGDYLLVETKAPDGYQLPGKPWLVTLHANDNSFEIKGIGFAEVYAFKKETSGSDIKYLLPNEKSYILPAMGGSGLLKYGLIGAVLILVSSISYWYAKRKKAVPGT